MKRLLSGIKPTGDLTIGNYIGALKNFSNMQKDYETFIFVADLHALTIQNNPIELKKRRIDIDNKDYIINLEYHFNNYEYILNGKKSRTNRTTK